MKMKAIFYLLLLFLPTLSFGNQNLEKTLMATFQNFKQEISDDFLRYCAFHPSDLSRYVTFISVTKRENFFKELSLFCRPKSYFKRAKTITVFKKGLLEKTGKQTFKMKLTLKLEQGIFPVIRSKKFIGYFFIKCMKKLMPEKNIWISHSLGIYLSPINRKLTWQPICFVEKSYHY